MEADQGMKKDTVRIGILGACGQVAVTNYPLFFDPYPDCPETSQATGNEWPTTGRICSKASSSSFRIRQATKATTKSWMNA